MSETPKTGLFAEIAQTYRNSRKAEDIVWNVYVARPVAAILVAMLRRTPATPNQVTIMGAIVFIAAIVPWVFWEHKWSFFAGVIGVQIAYLFDCADGQLARIKKMSSPAGAYFDFFIDEVKALLLVAGCSVAVWRTTDDVRWLLFAIVSTILVSTATSMTTFVRRPEYSGVDVKPGESAKKKAIPESMVGKVVWLANQVASYIIHYPSWILFVAIADVIGLIDGPLWFLGFYVTIYCVYIAKTGLGVLWKLGRPGFYK